MLPLSSVAARLPWRAVHAHLDSIQIALYPAHLGGDHHQVGEQGNEDDTIGHEQIGKVLHLTPLAGSAPAASAAPRPSAALAASVRAAARGTASRTPGSPGRASRPSPAALAARRCGSP